MSEHLVPFPLGSTVRSRIRTTPIDTTPTAISALFQARKTSRQRVISIPAARLQLTQLQALVAQVSSPRERRRLTKRVLDIEASLDRLDDAESTLIKSNMRIRRGTAKAFGQTALPRYLTIGIRNLQRDLGRFQVPASASRHSKITRVREAGVAATSDAVMVGPRKLVLRKARRKIGREMASDTAQPDPCPDALSIDAGEVIPSTPEQPDQRVSRILDVAVKGGPLVAGNEVFLAAAILLVRSDPSGQWSQSIDFDPDVGPVLFHVTAAGFEILSENKISLTVPREKDSKRVVFSLKVIASRDHWICITLFQNGDQIGQVVINDFSRLDKDDPHSERDAVGMLFHSDLTLIARSESAIIEAWSRTKDLNGVPMKEFKSPSTKQQSLMRDAITTLYDANADPKEQERELKIVGAELRKCLPDDLIGLLTSDDIGTLCLQHDKGMDFPFELCWFEEHGGFFLGDRIAVCRWFIGTRRIPRPRSAPVSNIAVLLGKSTASEKAAQLLADVLPAFEIFRSKTDFVEKILKQNKFDMIHFIGHCIKDKKGASIELEQGKVELISIGQLKEETKFGEKAPFVALNGCSTTASYVALFEEDSFAFRFVEAQACGFLGTLWPVDGRVANAFSRLFYRGLVTGLAVREALMDAKAKLIAEVGRDGRSQNSIL